MIAVLSGYLVFICTRECATTAVGTKLASYQARLCVVIEMKTDIETTSFGKHV